MSDLKNRYRLYRAVATICIALFVANMAFCLMCTDKYIYKKTYAGWIESEEDESEEEDVAASTSEVDYTRLSQFQAELIFQELSDDFLAFFSSKFEITGHELNAENVKALNTLKWRFRKSVVVVILSVIVFTYCYAKSLHRRRDLLPFLYGSILSVTFAGLKILSVVLARHGVKAGIKAMILHGDYGYFSQGDILEKLIPQDYARFMGLLYIFWVVVFVLVVLLVRKLIIFAGRPHKY